MQSVAYYHQDIPSCISVLSAQHHIKYSVSAARVLATVTNDPNKKRSIQKKKETSDNRVVGLHIHGRGNKLLGHFHSGIVKNIFGHAITPTDSIPNSYKVLLSYWPHYT